MSLTSHIDAIAAKRKAIKEAINQEILHASPNFEKIRELKKQNMTLKEEMMRGYETLNHSESKSSTA